MGRFFAGKQLIAQMLFERPYLMADSGGRQSEFISGVGKVTVS